ncbi:hypothetical protein DFH09DRAFT_1169824 [Mycena vulgaris]|nr:hypothetical protein DFH09DRAFT_1169824 [Mycena vulgaris]
MFSRLLWPCPVPDSVSTKLQHTSARYFSRVSKAQRRTTQISTLDPTRLRATDRVDLSSRLRYQVRIAEYPSEKQTFLQYCKRKGAKIVFPPQSSGFIYYHRPKELPFTAGALRFRIAGVNPAKFDKGRDLIRPDGMPWEVPLPTLSKTRPVLRELLLHDGLVTESELEQCRRLFPGGRPRDAQTLLHSFHQTFSVSFEAMTHIQILCGGQRHYCDVRVFHEQRLHKQQIGRPSSIHPYSGCALVRFELSTLPEHANSPAAVLRVVKMIDPPKLRIPGYDGYLPPPVEGELVQRHRGSRGVGMRIWARKLDSLRGKPLALLLDTSQSV